MALRIASFVMLLLVSVGMAFCQKASQEGNSELTRVTAGVIAYCYQNPGGNPMHQIYTVHADGTNNRRLMSAGIGLNHFDWSPDGKNIVAVGYMDATFTTWSLHTFAVGDTTLERISSVSNVADTEPAWSSDGSKIIFTRLFWSADGQMVNSRMELWVTNPDGTGQRYLGVQGYAAKWSPDGTKLIYCSFRSGNFDLFTCLADGTNEQRLTNTSAHETYPVWSPDGNQVVFSASTGVFNTTACMATSEIYLMDGDGTNRRQLTQNTCYDDYPRWSPDGALLAFNSDQSAPGHYEVYVMKTDGTNIQRVTNTPGDGTAINSVWYPVTVAHSEELKGSLPTGFRLYQNYPNPFNPTTTIRYELPRTTHVTLEVYDTRGKNVKLLVNEAHAAGSHAVNWDGSDHAGGRVPSGTYFLRLCAGGCSRIQKALLLK